MLLRMENTTKVYNAAKVSWNFMANVNLNRLFSPFSRFLFVLFLCFSSGQMLKGQGAIVYEFSNGTTGSQEYIELVVIGPDGNENCGPVDLRGFIVDDNNGDFSCGP
ncbi:MAG: hypothetical protein AAF570_23380, partial [Bacteroidota bacterium]